MYKFFNKIVRLFCLCVFLLGHSSADAQNRNLPADINPYFGPVGRQAVMPNAAGFIQRWLLLEPISMLNQEQCRFYRFLSEGDIPYAVFP